MAITTPVGPESGPKLLEKKPLVQDRADSASFTCVLFLQHLCPRAVLEQEGLEWVFGGVGVRAVEVWLLFEIHSASDALPKQQQ